MESLRPEDVDAIFKAAYKTQHQLAAQIAGAKKSTIGSIRKKSLPVHMHNL
jgi:hypothetical protein